MVKNDSLLTELLMEQREDMKEVLSSVAAIKEHLRTLNGRVGKSEDKLVDVEKQVRENSSFRSKLLGMAALLSIAVPLLITIIIKVFLR